MHLEIPISPPENINRATNIIASEYMFDWFTENKL